MEEKMKKATKFTLSIALFIVIALILILPSHIIVQANNNVSHSSDGGVQEQIDKLLNDYKLALDKELMNGQTKLIDDPPDGKAKILVGDSAINMDKLWKETVYKINEISARPIDERSKAINLIQSIESGNVTYLDRGKTPYSKNVTIERYMLNNRIYSISIESNNIIEINPINDRSFSIDAKYTKTELEEMARSFIKQVAGDINLDTLTPTFGNKEEITYFFRWEDNSSKLDDGSIPFIQVGYSRGGDFLGFINNLPLKILGGNNATKIGLLAIPFNEYYANGGSYWAWERQTISYSTQSNAGYCYYAGWCSPKNFYYGYTNWSLTYYTATLRGRWRANANVYVDAYAYIPSTHAVAIGFYYVWNNGGATMTECIINQLAWSNQFIRLCPYSYYSLTKIVLPNTSEGSTPMQLAWDETWVYNPTGGG
jgi:hypothetical protein